MHAGATIAIDDPGDPRLDDYREMRDRDLRGPVGRPGLFVVESALAVQKLLQLPGVAKSVLIGSGWAQRIAPLAPPGVPVYVAVEPVIEAVAGFRFHRGVLAVGHRAPVDGRTLEQALPRRTGPLTVLICESISNIDNIGALFRSAAAFAVDAVVLSGDCHDPLYRKSVRVSIGHVLTIPWARSADFAADLRRLRREWHLTLIGAATGTGARPLDTIPRPPRMGLVVGHEHAGLSATATSTCDHLARVPMADGVDSLNVAVAAAVCLHRFSRGARG